MNDLIKITPNEQGSSVVSGRELWTFLEAKKQFADWIKSRIDKYGLIEGQDYTTFSLISEKGRPTIEYALTLDAAKELAMVEGNAKGKEARQFFIEAEKQLRQTAPVLSSTTEQVLLQLVSQSNQLLANQTELLSSLRADVDSIMHGQKPARPASRRSLPGKQLGLPGIQPPGRNSGPSLRQSIHSRILDYCQVHQAGTQEVYSYLYKRLFEVYGVNAHRLMRTGGESVIDSIERYGHLDKVYSLIMAELAYSEE